MNKQNLVLLHGWGFNSWIWQSNFAYLAENFNVHALDLLGHGQESYNTSLHDLPQYLHYLIDKLTEKFKSFHILGWSLGGIIALNLKAKYPNIINKTILCCSNPCFVANDEWPYGVEQQIWSAFGQKLLTDQEKTIREFLLLQTMNHADSKQLYKRLLMQLQDSPQASLNGLEWGLNILQQDYREILNFIDQKDVCFIFGAKDSLVNKKLISWIDTCFPAIKTHLLEKSGHLPFITEPEKFYELLNFCTSRDQ